MKEICATILIGIGIQHKTTYFSLISYFVVAIPISVYTTFYLHWNYYGPWTGLVICTGANTLYYYVVYLRSSKEHSYFWNSKDADLPEYDHDR